MNYGYWVSLLVWLEQWGAAVGQPVDAVEDEEEDGGEQQEQSAQHIH